MSKLLKLLSFSLILSSCGSIEGPIKHNYHEIKNRLLNWNQMFEPNEDYYQIYFYSEKCGHCNDIKQDVLNYYFKSTSTMYFVCTDYEAIFGPKTDLTGIDNVNEFYIFGTPFLVEFKDHKVSNYYAGKEQILGFISI